VRHYGSMHGSVHVHMVYSVRAKLAVRITAPFAQLAAVGGGRDAVSMQKPGELGAVYAPSGTKASGYPWDLPHAVPVKAASAVMPERAGARTLPAAGRPPGTCSQRAGRGGHVPRIYLRYTFHALPMALLDKPAEGRLQVRYRVQGGGRGAGQDLRSADVPLRSPQPRPPAVPA